MTVEELRKKLQQSGMSDEEFLERMTALLNECVPVSMEEIDEELRAFGHDPRKVGKRMAHAARHALARAKEYMS